MLQVIAYFQFLDWVQVSLIALALIGLCAIALFGALLFVFSRFND